MRNKNLVINIPSDGLEEEVITSTDLSEEEYRQNVKRYIGEFLDDTHCGRMFFNVCYKRSVVHSDTADTYLYNIKRGEDGLPILDENENPSKEISQEIDFATLNRGYREMLKRNIDIIHMAVDEAKSYDTEAWFSVRMNDHHYSDDPGFNSSFAFDRAEELGVNGSRTYIDYTKIPVQNYYKNYIKELCQNYDIDGIELDFLRSCPVMSEVNEQNTKLLTQYVASVKSVVDEVANKKGRRIGVAVRCYAKEYMNLSHGLDVAAWISEGLVDILTVEGWYIPTCFDIPVEEWRKSIDARNTAGHPYTILCGTDWGVECDETAHIGRMMWISLEQFKGFASGAYTRGADGIYIFNHFSTDDCYHDFPNMGRVTCYIDENGNKCEKNVLKDKINAANSIKCAENGKRCYVNTYTDPKTVPYPITVNKRNPFKFEMNTGSKSELGCWCVVVGIDETECDDLKILVNGIPAKQIGDIPQAKDFSFEPSEEAHVFVNHVSETAARVVCFEAKLFALNSGINNVEIFSDSGEYTIRWLEIQVEEKKSL